MRHTARFSATALTCILALTACDKKTDTPSSSTLTPVSNADVAGTWELSVDSAYDAAYNQALGIHLKSGMPISESQLRSEAKSAIPATTIAAAGTLTLKNDGTFEARSFDTRTGTWTLSEREITVTIAGDPETRRFRAEQGALVMLPRLAQGRELTWRRR